MVDDSFYFEGQASEEPRVVVGRRGMFIILGLYIYLSEGNLDGVFTC
jgi:hypothetical protein